jgi:hypothetical protein
VHVQLYPLALILHVPPFLHGDDKHGLLTVVVLTGVVIIEMFLVVVSVVKRGVVNVVIRAVVVIA